MVSAKLGHFFLKFSHKTPPREKSPIVLTSDGSMQKRGTDKKSKVSLFPYDPPTTVVPYYNKACGFHVHVYFGQRKAPDRKTRA